MLKRIRESTYWVAPAEASGLANESVSLIMVAQALTGLIWRSSSLKRREFCSRGAFWRSQLYNLFRIAPEIDRLVDEFYTETVGPYWDFERTLVETGYRTINFPFGEIETPIFVMTAEWSLDHVLNYLRTWSATKRLHRSARLRSRQFVRRRDAEVVEWNAAGGMAIGASGKAESVRSGSKERSLKTRRGRPCDPPLPITERSFSLAFASVLKLLRSV